MMNYRLLLKAITDFIIADDGDATMEVIQKNEILLTKEAVKLMTAVINSMKSNPLVLDEITSLWINKKKTLQEIAGHEDQL